ncbi:unnamed protein product [Paramecium sonneborni]|uniref:MORN repeat protein n=1 Tax=Paramecium sonneborni TaxID=65129 RepID=A0A8S1RQT5_9CILI|nr:unnamed protein product [Paramecium sonneborni]
MNGMKIGRWDIMYCKYNEKEDQQIGGGSYDQEGNQKKIGKWVELDEQFLNFKQVTYNGEYNLNGMRVGIWDIMYCKKDEQEYKQIIKGNIHKNICSGSGFYDNEGNQKKIGKWIELDQSFIWNNVVTQIGEYNMKGQKEGIWVEMGIENQNKGETYYYN